MEKMQIRHYLYISWVVVTVWSLVACRPSPKESFVWNGGVVRLDRIHDSLSVVRHERGDKELSSWELPYPVYRFDYGDVNGDGIPEIAIGVVKGTRFFPEPAKRLFLFKLYEGRLIRPLWLGSRVANELVDFCIVRDSVPALIQTVERLPNDSIVYAVYRQQGFGIKFLRYLSK